MIKFEYGFQPYVRRTLIKDVTGKPITFENCFGGSLAWSKWYGSAAPLRQPTTPEVCLLAQSRPWAQEESLRGGGEATAPGPKVADFTAFDI